VLVEDSQSKGFFVRAPGRVCLFGEHSDYLGLDVIAAAIDLVIEIIATPRDDNWIHVDYSDLEIVDKFSLDSELEYRNKRDYIRSSFNVMTRKGFKPKHGWNLRVSGNIPLAAGLSSSSAMTVAAIMAIAKISGREMSNENVASIAYDAEVLEFGESGGAMDHYASAVGGIIHVNMLNNYVTQLPAKLGSIIIGDSGEKKKDTVGNLRYIRTTVEQEFEVIASKIESFDRRTTQVNRVHELRKSKPTKERSMAEAVLQNRDLTYRALRLLQEEKPNPKHIGDMLREHHEILRDALNRSTPKIERMIDAAYSAGARGCKINGSGGGGTMMAYCDGNEAEILSAINDVQGKAYIVKIGTGAAITKE